MKIYLYISAWCCLIRGRGMAKRVKKSRGREDSRRRRAGRGSDGKCPGNEIDGSMKHE
jgi:hypothetical protein